MNATTERTRTIAELATAVTEELPDRQSLVFLERGMTLSPDFVNALVRGSNPWETPGGESLTEWAETAQWETASYSVDELARDIVRRWEREDGEGHDGLLDEWNVSDARDDALHLLCERDDARWLDELINGFGRVLLRVGIESMNEDADLGFKPMTHAAFLDLLGFEHTPENLAAAAEVVDNASPEYSVAMGYAVVGVELSAICALPAEGGKVEIRNPHIWLGNPFMGSGWCGDDPFTGTLTVDRAALRTDADAFGQSWDKVVGGAYASSYAAEIAAVVERVTAIIADKDGNPFTEQQIIDREKVTDAAGMDLSTVELSASDLGCEPGTRYRVSLMSGDLVLGSVEITAH